MNDKMRRFLTSIGIEDVDRFDMDFAESDLHLQVEETDGYALATKEEIAEYASQGIFLHYDSIKEVFI